MRKRKIETLRMILQVQKSAIECLQKTSCRNSKDVYETAIMRQFQISYTTFKEYMKEVNVWQRIAEYERERSEIV